MNGLDTRTSNEAAAQEHLDSAGGYRDSGQRGLAMGIRQGDWVSGLLTFVVVVAAGALAWAAIARVSLAAGTP